MRVKVGLVDYLEEKTRPELPLQENIIEREKKISKQDKYRAQWILQHTYLCEGDLNKLKNHPEYDAESKGIEYIITHYASPIGKKGRCKKIIVHIPLHSNNSPAPTYKDVANILKIELFMRGANAGVFFKQYEKNNKLYCEAVPANIDGE